MKYRYMYVYTRMIFAAVLSPAIKIFHRHLGPNLLIFAVKVSPTFYGDFMTVCGRSPPNTSCFSIDSMLQITTKHFMFFPSQYVADHHQTLHVFPFTVPVCGRSPPNTSYFSIDSMWQITTKHLCFSIHSTARTAHFSKKSPWSVFFRGEMSVICHKITVKCR